MNQTMEKSIDDIIQSLKGNPMFHLSLGSKELFHSNFLEFLWEQNPTAFLEMLKEIVIKEKDKNQIQDLIKKIDKNKEYLKLAREKEHFDICIFHNESNKIVYDIIIENKVKSIPYKAQLCEYIDKIRKKKQSPVYILLSLAQNFAEQAEISKSWNVIDYKELESKIKTYYSNDNQYINDYCLLIKNLNELEEKLFTNNEKFFNGKIYESLKEIRLHDLYLKQSGSIFIGEISQRIKSKIKEAIIIIGKENRDDKSHKIFLSNTMNNGKSTLTATILFGKAFYTIQIEGDQYRHMFNSAGLAAKSCKKNSEKVDGNKLEKRLHNNAALNFVKFVNDYDVTDLSGDLNKNYCRYGEDVVYRYKKFTDKDDMLDIMANDIMNTYQKLLKASQINNQ